MFIDNEREQRYMVGDILNDTFHFYDSLDAKKENIKAYNDLMFAYISKLGRYCYPEDNGYIDNNQTLISGTIGLQITVYYNDYDQINILKSLKNLNLIDKLAWNINYTNSEEGYFINIMEVIPKIIGNRQLALLLLIEIFHGLLVLLILKVEIRN